MSAILANVLPVFVVIGLGAWFKRAEWLGEPFFKTADWLAYFVLLPALLFWKIAGQAGRLTWDWPSLTALVPAILLTWLLGLLAARLLRLPLVQVGSFVQAAFRFNNVIGLAVCLTAFGDQGAARYGVLISLTIPLVNLLAVVTLVWHMGERRSLGQQAQAALRAVVLNPLVLACLAGLIWAKLDLGLPAALDKSLGLLSAAALPLSLLSIGGALGLAKLSGRLLPALAAGLIKLAFMPALGGLLLGLAGVTGPALGVGLVFLALPTSPTNYVLSTQLGSDPDLAAAAIVFSTLGSLLSLSVVVAWLG